MQSLRPVCNSLIYIGERLVNPLNSRFSVQSRASVWIGAVASVILFGIAVYKGRNFLAKACSQNWLTLRIQGLFSTAKNAPPRGGNQHLLADKIFNFESVNQKTSSNPEWITINNISYAVWKRYGEAKSYAIQVEADWNALLTNSLVVTLENDGRISIPRLNGFSPENLELIQQIHENLPISQPMAL